MYVASVRNFWWDLFDHLQIIYSSSWSPISSQKFTFLSGIHFLNTTSSSHRSSLGCSYASCLGCREKLVLKQQYLIDRIFGYLLLHTTRFISFKRIGGIGKDWGEVFVHFWFFFSLLEQFISDLVKQHSALNDKVTVHWAKLLLSFNLPLTHLYHFCCSLQLNQVN